MTSDISLQVRRVGAARTPVGSGFVIFSHRLREEELRQADVIVLKNPEGLRVPGRYIGEIGSDSAAADFHEIDGLYRISEGGVPLSTYVDGGLDTSMPEQGRHDWGAMGLPEGPATIVRPIEADDASRDDVAVALASSGYRRYRADRSLSIAPGDIVSVRGERARLLAVDRRRRSVEIDINGDSREVGFDSIDDLENDA